MKKAIKICTLYFVLCILMSPLHAQTTYTDGVFVLNEDWYGHNNSTINFIHDDGTIDYRVFQAANAGTGYTFGATAQYGTIYGGKLFVISKQEQDPGEAGSSNHGARIIVADAQTLQLIARIETIYTMNGLSAADGRAFCGVDETKGYVSTSNGIFVLDFATWTITKRIAGTENPLIVGGEVNADGVGPLYHNQCGIMIRTHDYVFAVQQDKGVLVIDPETDTLVKVIPGCFSEMVQSIGGDLWAAANTNSAYKSYPYGMAGEEWDGQALYQIDPNTADVKKIWKFRFGGTDATAIEQTWYAWTLGGLQASNIEDSVFYYVQYDRLDWFAGKKLIKRLDLHDSPTVEEEYNFYYPPIIGYADNYNWYQYYASTLSVMPANTFYGSSFQMHPSEEKIYAYAYKGNQVAINEFIYYRFNADYKSYKKGYVSQQDFFTPEILIPIRNYWYPAMYIFPDNYAPTVKSFSQLSATRGSSYTIPLAGMATDRDNRDVAITKRVISTTKGITARVQHDTLFVSVASNAPQASTVKVRFNSNGKTVDKTLVLSVSNSVATDFDNTTDAVPPVEYYDLMGRRYSTIDHLPAGVYIRPQGNDIQKIYKQ